MNDWEKLNITNAELKLLFVVIMLFTLNKMTASSISIATICGYC